MFRANLGWFKFRNESSARLDWALDSLARLLLTGILISGLKNVEIEGLPVLTRTRSYENLNIRPSVWGDLQLYVDCELRPQTDFRRTLSGWLNIRICCGGNLGPRVAL